MSRRRGVVAAWLVGLAVLAGAPATCRGQANPAGERYALLVGVRKYAKSSELRELRYTERDMVELAQALRAGGYRPENLVLMTQTAGAEETRVLPIAANIRKELAALLRDRDESDGVLVAFAGHGVQFRGSDETYFCPADARLDDRGTLIALGEVYRALAACRAGFKLLLSDACRNDPIAVVSRRATADLESVTRPQRRRPPGGVAALFGCSEGELAFESEALRHGVFFHFVIDGLRGTADFDADGQVGLEELTLFAKKRVLDYVRAEYDGARQMPQLVSDTGGLFPLVRLAPSRPRPPDRPGPAPNSLGMGMVRIPAGTFLMGSPDGQGLPNEHPRHQVEISRPFDLGETEVTQAQYRRIMGGNPSKFPGDDRPVEGVSYEDAVEFCRKLAQSEGLPPTAYRLPTEAEWEYAARGGPSPTASPPPLGESAWFKDNADRQTHPVRRKRPNALGLFDMAGNVAEWCSDWFGPYAADRQRDPQGPSHLGDPPSRVLRGGSWFSKGPACRPEDRDAADPRSRVNVYGFRLVREVAPAADEAPPPGEKDRRR